MSNYPIRVSITRTIARLRHELCNYSLLPSFLELVISLTQEQGATAPMALRSLHLVLQPTRLPASVRCSVTNHVD